MASPEQAYQGYSLLRKVYGWFTAGFDTADVQKAEALIKELS
jgi:hypothetical protein